jgi:hypothetical protein
MDVAHYHEEYDDTVVESISVELSPEIASVLISNGPFSPLLKERLIRAAEQSREQRQDFLLTLQKEEEELVLAHSSLEDIDTELSNKISRSEPSSSFEKLFEVYTWLEDAERKCVKLLEERQKQRVTGHASVSTSKTPDLQTYLYTNLPVTYPVLADTTNLIGALRSFRQQISRKFISKL